MPAPIAHTFFAHRAFQRRLPGINLRAFIVGTHLPDARNVSGHPREHTHRTDVTFEDVLIAGDVFSMGFALHSYVDALHWRVFHDLGLTEKYYETRAISMAWKSVEDELLYTRIIDIGTVASFFEDILEDELLYGIEESHIEMWHDNLRRYFAEASHTERTRQRLEALGLEQGSHGEIVQHMDRFREDQAFPQHIEKVIAAFDEAIAV